MNRRLFLLGTTALVGCQNPPSISSWAQYASALANGLANAVSNIAAIVGLDSNTAATIKNGLLQIMSIAGVVGSVTDPKQAQPLALQIEQILNQVVAAAATFPGISATPVGIGIAAAEVVLPLLETAINQALGLASAVPSRSRLIPSMTPQAGLSYLQSVGMKH